jgi:hypothetical protein
MNDQPGSIVDSGHGITRKIDWLSIGPIGSDDRFCQERSSTFADLNDRVWSPADTPPSARLPILTVTGS